MAKKKSGGGGPDGIKGPNVIPADFQKGKRLLHGTEPPPLQPKEQDDEPKWPYTDAQQMEAKSGLDFSHVDEPPQGGKRRKPDTDHVAHMRDIMRLDDENSGRQDAYHAFLKADNDLEHLEKASPDEARGILNDAEEPDGFLEAIKGMQHALENEGFVKTSGAGLTVMYYRTQRCLAACARERRVTEQQLGAWGWLPPSWRSQEGIREELTQRRYLALCMKVENELLKLWGALKNKLPPIEE